MCAEASTTITTSATTTSQPTKSDPFSDLNLPTIPSMPIESTQTITTKPKESRKDDPFADLQLPPSPFEDKPEQPPIVKQSATQLPSESSPPTTIQPDAAVTPETPTPEKAPMPEDKPNVHEIVPPQPENFAQNEPRELMNERPSMDLPKPPNPSEAQQSQPLKPSQPQEDNVNKNMQPIQANVPPTSINPISDMGSVKENEGPGLPNTFFGTESPSAPDPFANLPKELLEEAGMPKEPKPSEQAPEKPVENKGISMSGEQRPKLTLADFEAEEAMFRR